METNTSFSDSLKPEEKNLLAYRELLIKDWYKSLEFKLLLTIILSLTMYFWWSVDYDFTGDIGIPDTGNLMMIRFFSTAAFVIVEFIMIIMPSPASGLLDYNKEEMRKLENKINEYCSKRQKMETEITLLKAGNLPTIDEEKKLFLFKQKNESEKNAQLVWLKEIQELVSSIETLKTKGPFYLVQLWLLSIKHKTDTLKSDVGMKISLKQILATIVAITVAIVVFYQLGNRSAFGIDHAISLFQMPWGFEKKFDIYLLGAPSVAIGFWVGMAIYYGSKLPSVFLGRW